MTAAKALQITKGHFDELYFNKGIDICESAIEGWARIAFRQEVFNSNLPKRIAKRLAKRYPRRYNHITFTCPMSVGEWVY